MVEKGRGLADLRGADPLGRRLEVEKQQLYAQALREQIHDCQRRRESSQEKAASSVAHSVSNRNSAAALALQAATSFSGAASVTNGPNSSCPCAGVLPARSSSLCLGRGVAGNADASMLTGVAMSPPMASEYPSAASSPNLSVRGWAQNCTNISLEFPCERGPSPPHGTPERTLSGTELNGGLLLSTDPNGVAGKVGQLQDSLRARLRSIEEDQQQQRSSLQNALQVQLATAREAAEKAARRELDVVLGPRVEEVQRLCEEVARCTAVSSAEEATRATLQVAEAAVEQRHFEDLERLRSELQHQATLEHRRQRDEMVDLRTCLHEQTSAELKAAMSRERDWDRGNGAAEASAYLVQFETLQSSVQEQLQAALREQSDYLQRLREEFLAQVGDTRTEEDIRLLEEVTAQRHQENLSGLKAAVREHLTAATDGGIKDMQTKLETVHQRQSVDMAILREEVQKQHKQIADACGDLRREVFVLLGEVRQLQTTQQCQSDALETLRGDFEAQTRRMIAVEGAVSRLLQDDAPAAAAAATDVQRCWAAFQLPSGEQAELAATAQEVPVLLQQLREDMAKNLGKLALRVEVLQRRSAAEPSPAPTVERRGGSEGATPGRAIPRVTVPGDAAIGGATSLVPTPEETAREGITLGGTTPGEATLGGTTPAPSPETDRDSFRIVTRSGPLATKIEPQFLHAFEQQEGPTAPLSERNLERKCAVRPLAFGTLRSHDDVVYELSQHTVIGRSASCGIQLAGSGVVSNKHASLSFEANGTAAVQDLGSRNGTLLNGRRVAPDDPNKLQHGDQLGFGGEGGPSFVFEYGSLDDDGPQGRVSPGFRRSAAASGLLPQFAQPELGRQEPRTIQTWEAGNVVCESSNDAPSELAAVRVFPAAAGVEYLGQTEQAHTMGI